MTVTRYRYGNLVLGGDIRANNIDDANLRGSGNSAYIPCVYAGHSDATYNTIKMSSGVKGWDNAGATDAFTFWELPLPTTRGALKLYVKNLIVLVADADVDDYIDAVFVYGCVYTGATLLNNDATNVVAAAKTEYTFSAVDASAYDVVRILVDHFCSTASELDVLGVLLECYYDT